MPDPTTPALLIAASAVAVATVGPRDQASNSGCFLRLTPLGYGPTRFNRTWTPSTPTTMDGQCDLRLR